MLIINLGDIIKRDELLKKLIDMTYERNQLDFHRGTFRVNGDIIDIIPIGEKKNGIRLELFGDEVDRISEFDILTGVIKQNKKSITIFPASHFVTSEDKLKIAIERIEDELDKRLEYFKDNNKYLKLEGCITEIE